MATLTAKNLAKAYKGRRVVEDVSLTVNSGEIVGLLGPNGAGKTTTFYMVVGIVPRDAGNIIIDDEDISLLPCTRARRGIGYLPQEASIFRRLSVYDNLMAVLQIRDDLSNEQREDRAKELMEEFHIEHLRDSLGQALSGGERRRVEIARALAANPKFILLDEPFAGVDPISVIDIKRIIEHLRDSGLGVLITDHNVRETLAVCERAYIVSQGHLIAHGTPQQILEDEQVKRVYLGKTSDSDRVEVTDVLAGDIGPEYEARFAIKAKPTACHDATTAAGDSSTAAVHVRTPARTPAGAGQQPVAGANRSSR